MRSNQRVNYAERIDKALALIERAFAAREEVPSLAVVSSAAALSEYHFHRIYRLMTGETIGCTIERVRLGGSLPLLETDGIMAATAQSGYATSQGFARAMRAKANATPSAIAADAGLRSDVRERLRHPGNARPDETGKAPPLAVEIVDFTPVNLVAVRNTGDYAELNIGYDRVFELVIAQLGENAITAIYGVPHHDPASVPPHELVFDCAVETGETPQYANGLCAIEKPGGAALHTVHHGDYDAINEAIDRIYLTAIAEELDLSEDLPLLHYRTPPDALPEAELRSDVYLFLGTS